jgi:hypothetical protein
MPNVTFTTEFIPLPEEVQTRTLPRSPANTGNEGARDPYRDDAAWIQAFSQHVSIAIELSRELTSWRERFDRATGAGGSGEAAASAAQEIGNRWEMFWSQLDDARALAQARGVNLSAYDKARDDARDLSSGAAVVEVGEWRHDVATSGRKRTVHFRVPRLEAARRALGALRAAVPAAQIVRQPDAPDLRTLSQRIPWTWIVLAIVAAAAILHFR